MAFTSGTVSGAFDKAYADELLGTGDGASSLYNLNFTNAPVFIAGIVLDYQVNGSDFQATSDANGDFTGTHITSASATETGITLQLDTVALVTDEFRADYTAKGLLTKIKEFIANDTHEEVLASGNGVQTNFSGTLANTNIAQGQARIEYTIGAETFIQDLTSADTWNTDNIVTGTLNRTTGAWVLNFDAALDNIVDNLKVIYSTGSPGRDWIVFDNETTKDTSLAEAFPGLLLQQIVLSNSGKNGDDRVNVGLRECQSVPNSYYSLDLNGYTSYIRGGDWNQSASGTLGHGRTSYDATRESFTAHPRVSLNDDFIAYNLYSNKNQFKFNARITGNRDVGAYLGNLLRVSPPSDYRYPLLIAGSHTSNANFTSTSSDHRFFIEGSIAGTVFLVVDPRDKFRGSNLPSSPNQCSMVPKDDEGTLSNAMTEDNTGERSLLPCMVFNRDDDETLGQIEDTYYCPNDGIQSNDVLEIGGDDYRVFQNVFRNTYQDFFCIKEV